MHNSSKCISNNINALTHFNSNILNLPYIRRIYSIVHLVLVRTIICFLLSKMFAHESFLAHSGNDHESFYQVGL